MKTRAQASRSRVLLPLAALALAAACSEEPGAASRHYGLSEETLARLEDQPESQAAILGALELLFGTPERPAFLLTADWVDAGFDPNWPWYAADDGGSGEFEGDRREEIIDGNRQRFASELQAIESGRYEAIGRFRGSPRLEENWKLLLAEKDMVEDFQGEARTLFLEHYPSLRDSAELYRLECLHCHGNEGGGNGPTAPFLNPRPRDYRHGTFKFTAVKDKARPRRADLHRILVEGVTGTSMPSFRRFSEAQIQGLVDYVRLLSIRGEVERLLAMAAQDEEPITTSLLAETYAEVWAKWDDAPANFFAYAGVIPKPTPAHLARGKEIFNDAQTGNCASCHDERGTGLGASAFKEDAKGRRVPAYDDDWGHPIVPRNLVQGIYRGGKRPIDIYRRIYAGINGTPMPALGDSKNAAGEPILSDEAMWSLVHYVRSLSEAPDLIGLEAHPILTASSHEDSHARASAQGGVEDESSPERGR